MTDEATVTLHLDKTTITALDAWIARHDEPRPTREEAAVQVLEGALGSHSPSTPMPNMVTGRDIV